MATIQAVLENHQGVNAVRLRTGAHAYSLAIPPKAGGFGSSASGGELLFLALAACYCNDIYREAAKRGLTVQGVEVNVTGDFEREGGPATCISYSVRIKADANEDQLLDLIRHTDQIAEVHQTLRVATPVQLSGFETME